MKQLDKILKEAILVYNLLSAKELEEYVNRSLKQGVDLRTVILKDEILTEKQLLIALSQSLDLEMVDLKNLVVDSSLIERIPVKFAWFYKFMPMRLEDDRLTVAVSLPMDVKIQDEIRMHIGFEIKYVLSPETEITEAFRKHYGFASDTIDRMMTKESVVDGLSPVNKDQWIEDIEQKNDDPTVAGLVNQIILEAHTQRATDIHIEPYRDKVRFRYRIDGVLVDAKLPDQVKHFLPSILSRIKIMANISITEKRLPQDGSAVVKTKEQNLDLRVSTIPTPWGESMVIRVLPSRMMLFKLEKLGFNEPSVKIFRALIEKPHGIIFITGPTGSGKTTSLYACLNEINSAKRKIITIEDPVEYEMEGITQVQVNPKVNFTFAAGLRSILRHDPDILMVGEVRDFETAEIAIKTALTGHLVFSTLHTNDSASGVTRLVDMGIEPYLVSSSVEAFVAQRLVRVVCSKCKEEVKGSSENTKEEIVRSLKLDHSKDIKIFAGKGCDHCNHTGYYGRMAIYEILVLDDVIRAAILEKQRSDSIKRLAMKRGLVTLRQNGWQAVLDGLTTPQEVMTLTTKDESPDTEKTEFFFQNKTPNPVAGPALLSVQRDNQMDKLKDRDTWLAKNKFDTRVYPRSCMSIEIQYRVIYQDSQQSALGLMSSEGEVVTFTQDLSAGGLVFSTNRIIPKGSIIDLKISLSNTERVACLAKVCRIEENAENHQYTVVVYYLDISGADRLTIGQVVDCQLKEREKVGFVPNN
jgi:type II secretory ATPase GspE/PulE/Tfp pilus assembly ATPase PilB-like protein